MERDIEELIADLQNEVRDEFKELAEVVILLREHSAKRNGYVESINERLCELKELITSRPCDERGKELEEMRLAVALLEQYDGSDKERWERVADVSFDIIKYVVTFAIGALLTWLVTGQVRIP